MSDRLSVHFDLSWDLRSLAPRLERKSVPAALLLVSRVPSRVVQYVTTHISRDITARAVHCPKLGLCVERGEEAEDVNFREASADCVSAIYSWAEEES